MKNNVKIFFIIFWSVITVALIVLLAFLINKNNPTPFVFHFGNHTEETTGTAQNLNEEYTIDDVKNVKIKVAALDVNVKKSSDDKARIIVKSNYKSKIDLQKNGDTISCIENTKDFTNWFHFGFNYDGNVTLELPENYNKNLDLETVSGEIALDGDYKLENVDMNLVSGDIRRGSITANKLNIKTVSGEVKLDRVKAPCECFTTSGEIKLNKLDGSLRAKSVSGEITADFTNLTGNIDAQSVSGDVKINLPQNSNIKFDCDTTSGDIDSNFSMNSSGKHHKYITVGDGSKYTGTIRTTSGSIDIN